MRTNNARKSIKTNRPFGEEAFQVEVRSEQRAHVRVRMRLAPRLRGTDASGKAFEEITTTENVSAEGLMCSIPSLTLPFCVLKQILMVLL
jgi:hypothetical protein